MKTLVISAVIVAAAGVGVAYKRGLFSNASSTQAADQAGAGAEGRGGRRGGGGFQGGGRGGGGRGPMTVELTEVKRASISQEIMVVGNLIGEATVAVAPRTAGRLEDVSVRLGDRVKRGQRIAKIEDFEIVEQVKQAEAAQEVSQATIRQREADLQLAETNVERSRSLFQRQLLPKQTLDDNEARYQAGVAQLDLARAQAMQSKARLDELRINLGNTIITSPVNGFIARRSVDPGAFVSQNVPVADVVDITTVRLVANIVERDLKELQTGDATRVEVDAFPGETFRGRIARVSPVLDPATRTAPIEIEIANTDFRLKPGMYARVRITTDTIKDALVLPADAVVDLGGRRGVFQPLNDQAIFRTVQVGSEQQNLVEILGGVVEGDRVITTGARALRDGDRIVLPGGAGNAQGRGRRGADGGADGARGSAGSAPSGSNVPSGGAREGAAASPRRGGAEGRQGSSGDGSSRRYGGDGSRRSGGDGNGQRQGGQQPPSQE